MISLKNPLKTWWKARKYFQFPDLRFILDRYGKWFSIESRDIMWKDKYNSPRHEINPYIEINLFKFIFRVEFIKLYKDDYNENRSLDSTYWEYLLDYLYYSHNLDCYPVWVGYSRLYYKVIKWGESEDGSSDVKENMLVPIPVVANSLNKRGIKKLKEIHEAKRNSENS